LFARSSILTRFRNTWDAVNTIWNDNIVEFSVNQQRSMLASLGIEDADWRDLGWGLVATFIAFFGALSLYLALKYRPPSRDPLVQPYEQLCKRLARKNLPRAEYEGPHDYLTRVALARPDLAAQLDEVRTLYVNLRYGPTSLGSQLSRLKYLINQLRV
jgi:hypothetical protein